MVQMHSPHIDDFYSSGSQRIRSIGDTNRYFHSDFLENLEKLNREERGPRRVTMSDDEGIITPHENDVLLGRGGKNNQHSGNEALRQLARAESVNYRDSSKKGKSNISRDLVQKMRALSPPGRFLKRDPKTGLWEEAGDETAREKASQVLRDAVNALGEELNVTLGNHSEMASPEHHRSAPILLLPVTPVETGRRKRQRIEQLETRIRCIEQLEPYDSLGSRNSSIPRHTVYHAARRREQGGLLRPQTIQNRQGSTASASNYSLLGEVDEHLQEFDLFNGELLESDDE